MKKISLVLIVATLLFASSKHELFLGHTYDFAEKDFIVAVKEYIQNHKKEIIARLNNEKKKVKENIMNFKPKGLIPLTPANKDRIFYPDMTYTLDRDITDIEGKIIYPKGFKFNPLKYIHLSYGIVVINGNNKKEVNWFKNSKYANTLAYRLFLSDGNYYKLIKELKQPVFYCLPKITERFHLKHTPSIITQIGNQIKVEEVCLKCKDKKDTK